MCVAVRCDSGKRRTEGHRTLKQNERTEILFFLQTLVFASVLLTCFRLLFFSLLHTSIVLLVSSLLLVCFFHTPEPVRYDGQIAVVLTSVQEVVLRRTPKPVPPTHAGATGWLPVPLPKGQEK